MINIDRYIKKMFFLFTHRYCIVKAISYKDYSLVSQSIKYILLQKNRRTCVFPIRFFLDNKQKACIQSELPDLFYAIVENCHIIGESNSVITDDGYILYDYLCGKYKTYVNVTDAGLLLLFNRAVHVNDYYLASYTNVSTASIDVGIKMSGVFSRNYYHFVLEYLVKFDIISKAGIDKNIPLIMDESIKNIPQFLELINLYNIEKRKIVFIKRHEMYEVKKLYSLSAYNEIPPNLKRNLNEFQPTDFAYDYHALLFLRGIMDVTYSQLSYEKSSKRIFVSRKSCTVRRNNEEELLPILKKYGFDIVFPEKMNVQEQYICFSNADCVIAASGAALTNLIYCKPNCKVLIFQSCKADITIFSNIAGLLNLSAYYLTPEQMSSKLHPDFVINKNQLEEYLTQLEKLFNKNNGE